MEKSCHSERSEEPPHFVSERNNLDHRRKCSTTSKGEFVQTYELASTTGASTTLPFRVTTITTNPTTTDPSAAT